MLKGFKEFIMRGNVLDLAVAVIIGAAFNKVVNSLVVDVLTPLIGAIFGAPDFSALKLGPIAIGNFLNAVVNFIIVSAAIYFFIVAPMNAIRQRKAKEKEQTPPEPSEEVKLLREILEVLKEK
ncbi:large conductance mechanosensitive channel protein [Thermoanaerobacter mathranii subsp. mathranii str. A3]|jgi:large conductance mechanosensitive channel|uniref:Large-conductance mechanosensitive channel n=4 Tax=Thermoanaerobacter TaxID=1754 RepID=A0A1M4X1J1_9THEO|nr:MULTISPECIES: large conductance mechanosensitive channel protein MscL [Thermoanaerobacter]EGD52442.1 large conductance mechanosensitive channel protein [Thermoanaerobacter ethanolicus JW 200]ADH61118.1 large conductance mechanosensitive channel protein [Thermoanaerobacter mathranii subsp. mathranii str. A3]AEM78917.1 large conductance mechanosensitive channel protein [Thermoanaerobacter wiegelii Rt8.B1]EMT38870.1 large conductance mechanosensitive channel protein [Thermoanaerobacter thermohy